MHSHPAAPFSLARSSYPLYTKRNQIQRSTNPLDPNPFRYCGEYTDGESGQVYLRNRYYDPGTGRFTNEDPIRSGVNWYAYCGGNPVGFVDPLGLFGSSVAYGPDWDGWAEFGQSPRTATGAEVDRMYQDRTNRAIARIDASHRAREASRFVNSKFTMARMTILTKLNANPDIAEDSTNDFEEWLYEYPEWVQPGSSGTPTIDQIIGHIFSSFLGMAIDSIDAVLDNVMKPIFARIFGDKGVDMIEILPKGGELVKRFPNASEAIKEISGFFTAISLGSNILNTWTADNGLNNGQRLVRSILQILACAAAYGVGAVASSVGKSVTVGLAVTPLAPAAPFIGIGCTIAIIILGNIGVNTVLDYAYEWAGVSIE